MEEHRSSALKEVTVAMEKNKEEQSVKRMGVEGNSNSQGASSRAGGVATVESGLKEGVAASAVVDSSVVKELSAPREGKGAVEVGLVSTSIEEDKGVHETGAGSVSGSSYGPNNGSVFTSHCKVASEGSALTSGPVTTDSQNQLKEQGQQDRREAQVQSQSRDRELRLPISISMDVEGRGGDCNIARTDVRVKQEDGEGQKRAGVVEEISVSGGGLTGLTRGFPLVTAVKERVSLESGGRMGQSGPSNQLKRPLPSSATQPIDEGMPSKSQRTQQTHAGPLPSLVQHQMLGQGQGQGKGQGQGQGRDLGHSMTPQGSGSTSLKGSQQQGVSCMSSSRGLVRVGEDGTRFKPVVVDDGSMPPATGSGIVGQGRPVQATHSQGQGQGQVPSHSQPTQTISQAQIVASTAGQNLSPQVQAQGQASNTNSHSSNQQSQAQSLGQGQGRHQFQSGAKVPSQLQVREQPGSSPLNRTRIQGDDYKYRPNGVSVTGTGAGGG
ncbi:unnamed protein product, partial [Choristocarpus tenellus]